MEPLLKIQDVSKLISMTPAAIYKLTYQRQIPFIKIGGRLRFNPQQIEKWISKNSYDMITPGKP